MTDAFQTALGSFYRDHVVSGKSKHVAVSALRDLVSKDQSARDAAKAKLTELNKLAASCGGKLEKRCFVSHVQKMALEEALSG